LEIELPPQSIVASVVESPNSKQGLASNDPMTDLTSSTSTSASSSSTDQRIADIERVIAPGDREAFQQMLKAAIRGRELPADELRRVAVTTWHQFTKHGWPRDT
jgi:hypothetical protein